MKSEQPKDFENAQIINVEDIECLLGTHCALIISNGMIKKLDLPKYGETKVISQDNKFVRFRHELGSNV